MHETSAISLVTASVGAVLTFIAVVTSVYAVPGFPAKILALGLRHAKWHWYLVSMLATIAFALGFAALAPTGGLSFAGLMDKVQTGIASIDHDKLNSIAAILIPLLVYEIVVRGIVLQGLFQHMSNLAALLLAALFGLSQIATTFLSVQTPVAMVVLLAVTQLALSYIAAKSGSIWPSMLASGVLSVAALLAMY
jgi:membrane protease YdiL (CAAX protease family)